MDSCRSHTVGGCLNVIGRFHQMATSSARFRSCKAWIHGGCVSVNRSMNLSGLNSFDQCEASGEVKTGWACKKAKRELRRSRGDSGLKQLSDASFCCNIRL